MIIEGIKIFQIFVSGYNHIKEYILANRNKDVRKTLLFLLTTIIIILCLLIYKIVDITGNYIVMENKYNVLLAESKKCSKSNNKSELENYDIRKVKIIDATTKDGF